MTQKNLVNLLFILFCFFQLKAQNNPVKRIQSNKLAVTVDTDFPLIKKYEFLDDRTTFKGNTSNKKEILINNEVFKPAVKSTVNGNSIMYTLVVNELAVLIKIRIKVIENIIDFQVIEVQEKGDFKVHTIAFPEHEVLSINSKDKDAAFAGSKMFTAVEGTKGDIFENLHRKTPIDTIAQGYLFGILSNNKIAATLWSNALEEKTDSKRVLKQTKKINNTNQISLWSGSWIYRAQQINTPHELPHLKIILTKDANKDKKIDWQDGAIAYRKIMNNPLGAERVKDWVVFRIPMNFASQATNPFSKSLDETKRMFLNTDGLGQFVILKGYGGEGHDSNHPDYGYVGTRQGGVEGINLICNKANTYNADIGVHINGTESYPEASMFNETLVSKKKPGWNWLDQSYYINKRNDAINNKRQKRLASLKTLVPNLDFIYLDVWYAKGSWDSRKIAKEINDLGLILTTEFPQDLEYNAVWNHWAVDYKYGGKNIKGFNSKIARFIRNHQKDTWIAKHPLLGGAEMLDFEGWQGRVNYDNCINITFQTNLPTKYLQHFPILKWDNNSILCKNNVKITNKNGLRTIYKDGRVVYNKDAYLLPWKPIEEEKLYHWNAKEGKTTWTLPQSWNGVHTAFLYRLTDLGKELITEIPVTNKTITIHAAAKTPYVIYKNKQDTNQNIIWGEGTLVKNGGFNSGNTQHWNTTGNAVSVLRDTLGHYLLQVKPNQQVSTITQDINNLPKGRYCAESYVQTSNNRKAALIIKKDSINFENYTTSSLWKNHIAADDKKETNMQRLYTFFNIDKYHKDVQIQLKIDAGDGTVYYDDVRLYKLAKPNTIDSLYFYEDFENIPNGLYPFVKGDAGGVNDPRVHLSEKHSPYTQKGWNNKRVDDVLNGNWSLKIHEDAQGIIIQTIPQNLRFKPNKKYQISFKYQSETDDYSFIVGNNSQIIFESKINPQHKTQVFECVITGAVSGNSWFGIKKTNKKTSDFILDDLKVVELKN